MTVRRYQENLNCVYYTGTTIGSQASWWYEKNGGSTGALKAGFTCIQVFAEIIDPKSHRNFPVIIDVLHAFESELRLFFEHDDKRASDRAHV